MDNPFTQERIDYLVQFAKYTKCTSFRACHFHRIELAYIIHMTALSPTERSVATLHLVQGLPLTDTARKLTRDVRGVKKDDVSSRAKLEQTVYQLIPILGMQILTNAELCGERQ